MKTLYLAALGAALFSASAASAETVTPLGHEPGLYFGLGIGWNAPENRNITVDGSPAQIRFKDSVAALGAIGYRWGNGVRSEFEINYGQGDVKNTGASGKQRDTSFMVNMLYDFSTGTNWVPYVGVGAGAALLRFDQVQAPNGTIYRGSSHNFTWQGIVGVSYLLSPETRLFLDYRYKGSGDHSYNGSVAGSSITNYNARASRVMLGISFTLDEPKKVVEAAPPPPPAPMAAAPAAPPPQPVAQQKFLVFFDFDKSNLRNDAKNIVSEAADYAKKTGKATITATGHTDTSGTAAYNLGLSERRADAVQKELNRLGIPSSEIVVRWKGESEPLVQTGDGVKEPQNRRVEIVIE
jgi:outer membrane protein OmpA-like peptidoglycan-associated protein